MPRNQGDAVQRGGRRYSPRGNSQAGTQPSSSRGFAANRYGSAPPFGQSKSGFGRPPRGLDLAVGDRSSGFRGPLSAPFQGFPVTSPQYASGSRANIPSAFQPSALPGHIGVGSGGLHFTSPNCRTRGSAGSFDIPTDYLSHDPSGTTEVPDDAIRGSTDFRRELTNRRGVFLQRHEVLHGPDSCVPFSPTTQQVYDALEDQLILEYRNRPAELREYSY